MGFIKKAKAKEKAEASQKKRDLKIARSPPPDFKTAKDKALRISVQKTQTGTKHGDKDTTTIRYSQQSSKKKPAIKKHHTASK